MASSSAKAIRNKVSPIEKDPLSDSGFVRSEISQTKNTLKDQFTGTGGDFISQLLGLDYSSETTMYKMEGEMQEGQMIDLQGKKKKDQKSQSAQPEFRQPEKRLDILAGIDYRSEVVHGSERLSRREATELNDRISEILTELKRLIGSSSILRAEFAVLSVENKPIKSGKYYTNFFEWLLLEVKRIRMKVEDAGAWLSVMKSKKSQKKYGAMAKKHGTSFTLNNERTAATQTG